MISMRNIIKKSRMDVAWLLPILAILGSAFSMIVIGIPLTHFDNQAAFYWNGVTFNTIVVVFFAIFKPTLTYALSEYLGQAKWIWFLSHQRLLSDINLIDNGNRETLDSLQILTRTARSFINMGAILVILPVIMDSFVQLTIDR